MTIDRAVMAFAGLMILLSLTLAYLFSPYWLALAAFVGAKPCAVFVHRLLPLGYRLEAPRGAFGRSILVAWSETRGKAHTPFG